MCLQDWDLDWGGHPCCLLLWWACLVSVVRTCCLLRVAPCELGSISYPILRLLLPLPIQTCFLTIEDFVISHLIAEGYSTCCTFMHHLLRVLIPQLLRQWICFPWRQLVHITYAEQNKILQNRHLLIWFQWIHNTHLLVMAVNCPPRICVPVQCEH